MRPAAACHVAACLVAALFAAPALQAETVRFTATGLIHHEEGDILGTGASALGQTLSVSIDLSTPLVHERTVEGLDGWALLTGGAAGTPLSAALDRTTFSRFPTSRRWT